jgi:hypothetical protein
VTPEDQTRINVLVAKHIFGMVPCKNRTGRCEAAQMDPPRCWQKPEWSNGSELEDYCCLPEPGFHLLREMARKGYWLRIEAAPDGSATVEFSTGGSLWPSVTPERFKRTSDTILSTVCLAALEAVGVHCELSPDK